MGDARKGGMRWVALMIVGVLMVVVRLVSADTVLVLYADNCGWTDGSPMACSQTKYVSCNVSDTHGGAVTVTSVDFIVNGRTYPASLYSGTAANGVWRAAVNRTYESTTQNIDKVTLRNSLGWICMFSPTVTNPLYQGTPEDPYSCFISFQGRTAQGQTCTGSPNACSSYANSSACNAAAGCNWSVQTTTNTSPYIGPASNSAYSGGGWSNPANVQYQDGSYANGKGVGQLYYSFPGMPANAIVTGSGLRVRLYARASTSSGDNRIYVSIGNGTFFSPEYTTGDMGTTFSNYDFVFTPENFNQYVGNISKLTVHARAQTAYYAYLDFLGVSIEYYIPSYCGGNASTCASMVSSSVPFSTNNQSCVAVGCTYTPPVGSMMSVDSWCPCEMTVTTVKVPGKPNVCTTTWVPSAGCVGATVRSTTGYCDWCDPDWQVSYGQCVTDRYASNPFAGFATKKYTAANASCYDLTGLDEDKIPPADADKQVACLQDFYVTGGGDAETTSHGQQANSLNEPEVYSTSFFDASNHTVFKPLVFDMEGDGTTEMIVFEDLSGPARLKVFKDSQLSGFDSTFSPEFNGYELKWAGQPGLFGFSVWGENNTYAWNDDLKSRAVGIGLASIMFDLGTAQYRFVSWRVENGLFVQKMNATLAYNSQGAGVNCFVDDCFFIDGGGILRFVNALGEVSDRYGVAQDSRVVGWVTNNAYMDSMPAFMTFGADANGPIGIAVEGALSSEAAVYVCPMNLSSNVSCNSFALDGVPIGKVSRIVVQGGLSSDEVLLYFTTNDGDESRLWRLKVNSSMVITDDWSVALSSIGGTSNCVSDPAMAYCSGGGRGVALATHWVYPSGNSSGYNEYSCYSGMTKSFGLVEREEYCPSNVATQELSWDSSSAIVSPSGIFGYNRKIASISGATNYSSVIVVDLTASTYTGITTISKTTVKNIVSTIPVYAITTSETLGIGDVRCEFNPDAKSVIAIAYGVTAPKKDWVEFSASYMSDTGMSGYDEASGSPRREFVVSTSGTYIVTVRATDIYSGDYVEKSCTVGATVAEAQVVASVCSLGENNADGSFNYDEDVTYNDWVKGALTTVNNVDAKYIEFKQDPGYAGSIIHAIACNDQRIRIEARVRASNTSTDSGDSRIGVMARTSQSVVSPMVSVASTRISRYGTLPYVAVVAEAYTGDNDTLVYQSNVTEMNWLRIGVTIDRMEKKVYTEVVEEKAGGDVTFGPYVTTMKNDATGQFSGIMLYGTNGFDVDYVKITNQSGITMPVTTPEQDLKIEAANAFLKNCEGVEQAENYGAPSERNNRTSSLGFTHVKLYCDRISNTAEHQSNPGYCTFKDLQNVVVFNSNCYMEAFRYCVNTTYIKTAGFEDSGLKSLTNVGEMSSLEVESTGGDGGGVCAAALGISVITSKQALPFISTVYVLLTDYWVYLLVIVVAIIIIGGMSPREGG